MSIYPGMQNPPYDIEFSDGQDSKPIGISLYGKSAIQQGVLSEDTYAAYIRNVGKQFGDFDEQRSWENGMAHEYLTSNPDGFVHSENCWSLSSNHLHNGLQWKFFSGYRNQSQNMPDESQTMNWKSLLGRSRYIEVSFTAAASYDVAKIWSWIRKIGNPGTLTVELTSDSSGSPGTVRFTDTKANTDYADVVSVFSQFSDTPYAITSTTVYHVKIYGASTDNSANHWQVLCDTSVDGKVSSDNSTWITSDYSPFYRATDADVNRSWWFFMYEGLLYAVDRKASEAASAIYINGERGVATSAAATTITDTNSGLRGAWTTNMWAGAYIKIIRGTGSRQIRQIISNTNTEITVATWDKTPDSTSSYIIYGTNLMFLCPETHGLGCVSGPPAVVNSTVYFPQGAAVNMRRMKYDDSTHAHLWAADSTNKCDFLCMFHNGTDVKLWAALNTTTVGVYEMAVPAWATDLTFGSVKSIGSTQYPINNLLVHDSYLYVFKSDSIWKIGSDGKPIEQPYGLRATPDAVNGIAAASHNLYLYWSWLWSIERLYGTTVDDVGVDWSGLGMPDGMHGYISKIEPAVGWMFYSVNAGTGTSSVVAFNGLSHHPIFHGFEAGREIKNIKWQIQEGTNHRIVNDIGGDIVFQDMPYNTATPLMDSTVDFQHEGVITLSTIDMGAGARLPKYIRKLALLSKGLGESGMTVEVDLQTDENIGTSDWITMKPGFSHSPEQQIDINQGDIRQIRFRLRINISDSRAPIDIRGIVPNGFARVPFRKTWNIRARAGDIVRADGSPGMKQKDLLEWLETASMNPGMITMSSIWEVAHGHNVILSPVTITPETSDRGMFTFQVMEA